MSPERATPNIEPPVKEPGPGVSELTSQQAGGTSTLTNLAVALSSQSSESTWPEDNSAYWSGGKASLGRHEVPPDRPNPDQEHRGLGGRLSQRIDDFQASVSIGEDTITASEIAATAMVLVIAARYASSAAKSWVEAALQSKLATGLAVSGSAVAGVGALVDFKRWFRTAWDADGRPTEIAKARSHFDAMFAKLVVISPIAMRNLPLRGTASNPKNPALDDPNVIDAKYRHVSPSDVSAADRSLAPAQEPGLAKPGPGVLTQSESNAPIAAASTTAAATSSLVRSLAKAWVPAGEALGTLLAPGPKATSPSLVSDERGSFAFARIRSSNAMTAEPPDTIPPIDLLVEAAPQYAELMGPLKDVEKRWPSLSVPKRRDLVGKALNDHIARYGLPQVRFVTNELYPSGDTFLPLQWEITISETVLSSEDFPAGWMFARMGYWITRAMQCVQTARVMHLDGLPTKTIEKSLARHVVAAALVNIPELSPAQRASARELFDPHPNVIRARTKHFEKMNAIRQEKAEAYDALMKRLGRYDADSELAAEKADTANRNVKRSETAEDKYLGPSRAHAIGFALREWRAANSKATEASDALADVPRERSAREVGAKLAQRHREETERLDWRSRFKPAPLEF